MAKAEVHVEFTRTAKQHGTARIVFDVPDEALEDDDIVEDLFHTHMTALRSKGQSHVESLIEWNEDTLETEELFEGQFEIWDVE